MQSVARITGIRQLYHAMSGLALVFIISFLDKPADAYLILILLSLTIMIEAARLYLPPVNRIFINYFGILMRSEEKHNPTGTLYYLLGALLALLLFPRGVALFSMTVLAVGDPFAYIVGHNFGRIRIGRKSLEGSLAFFTSAVIAGFLLHRFWNDLSATEIITGTLTGAVTELIPVRINDNLTIPVAASAAMYVMSVYVN